MKKAISHISYFFTSMDGVFKHKSSIVPDELESFYEKVLSDLEMIHAHEDKYNVNSDLFNVYQDAKKALENYKKEHNVSKTA